jgi:hypothetical protein
VAYAHVYAYTCSCSLRDRFVRVLRSPEATSLSIVAHNCASDTVAGAGAGAFFGCRDINSDSDIGSDSDIDSIFAGTRAC